jgi:hypothetical protein
VIIGLLAITNQRHGNGRPVSRSELPQYSVNVKLDGPDADGKLASDFLVRHTASDERGDLRFA